MFVARLCPSEAGWCSLDGLRQASETLAASPTGEKLMKVFKTLAVIALALVSSAAFAADYPAPKEGQWIARDFKFHSGEVMPELRIHYTTVGEPSGQPVLVLHGTTGSARSMLTPGRAVRGRPAARCGEVFYRHSRFDRPREVVQTLRRDAHEIPAIQLRRHGRGAVPAHQGGAGH